MKQGPDGLKEFTSRIRELFRLPEDVDISLTFGCKEPMSGQHLKLEGIGAFDAAVHCASVAAAERQHKIKSQGSTPASSAAGSPASSAGGAAPNPSSGGGAPHQSHSRRMPPALAASPNGPASSPASGLSPSTPQTAMHPSPFESMGRRSRSHHASPSRLGGTVDNLVLPPIGHNQGMGMGLHAPSPLRTATSLNEPLAPITPPANSTSGRTGSSFHMPLSRARSESLDHASSLAATGSNTTTTSHNSSSGGASSASLRTGEAHDSHQDDASTEALSSGRRVRRDSSLMDECHDDDGTGSTLTGRLKFTLKAFSRKVARSLNFKTAEPAKSPGSVPR